MFLPNKYTTTYNNIINKAKFETRIKSNNIYYESHHIIPKSLGGTNDKTNLVLLTAKEHYICHLLLPNMVKLKKYKIKMFIALRYLQFYKSKHHKRYTSKLYEIHKKKFIKLHKAHMKNITNTYKFKSIRRTYCKNSKWIHHPITLIEKFVLTHNIPNYINQGYIIGRNKISTKNISKNRRCYKGKNNPSYGISRPDVIKRNKIPKTWVHNKNISKLIITSKLKEYLSKGFQKGRLL